MNRDVELAEDEMPCLKTKSESMSEEEKCEERDQLNVEVGKLSTYICAISNEVENREKIVIDEHPKKNNSLADYNLARDRERGQMREPRKFKYISKLGFVHSMRI